MVFLDEPTSGLDSFSALQVCAVLKKVAQAGASVLFTIHQPSSEIFESFDHLILLQSGRVMYQGPIPLVSKDFETKGYPVPSNYNPADWVISVAQRNSIDKLEASGFFGGFQSNDPKNLVDSDDEFETFIKQKSSLLDVTLRPHGLWVQVQQLFLRELMHMSRFAYPLYCRYGLTIILSMLVGTIFFKIGETEKNNTFNLQSHFGALMCLEMFALLGTAQPALMFFPEERPIFLREYSTDHYSVVAYFISRFLVEAVVTGVQVSLMVFIIFYMVKFQGSVWVFLGATYLLAMSGTAMAVTLGALVQGNGKVAQQLLPIIFMPQILFSGFFVSPDLIPAILRWVQHICVLTYAVRTLVVEEFVECSEELIANQICDFLVKNVKANPDRVWLNWVVMFACFLFFRLLALRILQNSATTYY
jgi:ABC-2 type transporter